MTSAKKTVTLSLFFCLIIVVAKRGIKGAFPRPRVFLGLSISFVLIGFLVEFAPKLAAAFSLLIATALVLTDGPDLFATASKTLTK